MAATADRPASRGREPPRTDAQKLEAARRFFAAFRPPGRWRFAGWNQVAEAGGRVLSVRAVFRDGGTAYAVCFVLAPERGAICEKDHRRGRAHPLPHRGEQQDRRSAHAVGRGTLRERQERQQPTIGRAGSPPGKKIRNL